MIEIEKLSKENKKFGLNLFFSYLLFAVLIVISIILIHIYFSSEQLKVKFQRQSALISQEKVELFNNYFIYKKDAILALANNPYFIEFVKNGKYRFYTDLLFYTIMDENKAYMQVRFLDENGNEKLRFDRIKPREVPFKVGKLQNKSHRYYFKACCGIDENRVWFSNIDLNIEHGEVQKPFTPVARVGTPIYIDKKFKGILIINIFMENFLKNLTRSSIYDVYLVDKNNNFMIHRNSSYNWSNYLEKKYKTSDEFGEEIANKIQKVYNESLIYENKMYIKPLFLQNQKMLMLFVSKDETIKEMESTNNKMIAAILIFAIIISMPFAFILSRPLNDMFEVVIHQGDKLHDLATNLEKKVEEESLKNAKKDRLLQHQSKMAELGDMIGNIAHQWRHPLTRLSLLLQNLKAYKNKGKMNDRIFDETLENSIGQINFMSNTIDNFKDFYKTDNTQEEFTVQECITDILNIIGSDLEHNNIKVNIQAVSDVKLHGNKNQFSHVLLNIIVNAKDALVENKILDPNINIKLENKKQTVITIEDNAGGIKEEFLEEIFNPYFTTKEEKGTGIGLYLCKTIIEDEMNGVLKAENLSDGARFQIIMNDH